MKKLVLLISLLQCSHVAAFDSPQALQDAFMAAMRASDVDGLAACYTPDATNFTPDKMIGYGPDSVRESWGAFFEEYRVKSAELSHDRMEVSGDLAAAWGLFTIVAEPLAGGEPVTMKGRYMDVARDIGGEWLYIADHASVPLPADE